MVLLISFLVIMIMSSVAGLGHRLGINLTQEALIGTSLGAMTLGYIVVFILVAQESPKGPLSRKEKFIWAGVFLWRISFILIPLAWLVGANNIALGLLCWGLLFNTIAAILVALSEKEISTWEFLKETFLGMFIFT